jgi:hypothetical protein
MGFISGLTPEIDPILKNEQEVRKQMRLERFSKENEAKKQKLTS